MREKIAIISEPNRILTGNWRGNLLGNAAVYWEPGEHCKLINRGEGFIIVEWRKMIIASVYFSPNERINKFKELLEELNRIIGSAINGKVLIGGISMHDLGGGIKRIIVGDIY